MLFTFKNKHKLKRLATISIVTVSAFSLFTNIQWKPFMMVAVIQMMLLAILVEWLNKYNIELRCLIHSASQFFVYSLILFNYLLYNIRLDPAGY